MSHSRRAHVNKLRNQQEAMNGFQWDNPSNAWQNTVFIKTTWDERKKNRGQGNRPQNMVVWQGPQLIVAGRRCLKGMFCEVKEVDEVFVELTNGARLTHEQAMQSLRLSYALTYASCQGLTLKGDTQSPNITLKHLYVGISRAIAADLVEVV